MIKEKILHNWKLKLCVLLFAIIFWRIVGEVADPVTTITYRNVPVTIINEEIVTDTGMVYQVTDDTMVTVIIKGTTSALRDISIEDIVATADFNDLMLEELIPINVTIQGSNLSAIQEITVTPLNILVSIEESTSKKFPIVPSSIGTVADGFALGTLTSRTETLTISGPKSIVDSIVRVEAEINIANLTTDTVMEATLICYDDDNNEIEQSLLTFNTGDSESVLVDVTIWESAYIPIELETSGEPEEGYQLISVTAEPTEIRVTGTQEVLDEIDVITIPGSALDISGESGKLDRVVDISLYLPDDVQLYDVYSNTIAVTIQIDELGTKSIEIPVQSMIVYNNPQELGLKYNGITDVMLTFTGLEEDLENLESSDIVVSIDLSGYDEAGEYEVVVDVEISSSDEYELVGSVSVPIVLSEK